MKSHPDLHQLSYGGISNTHVVNHYAQAKIHIGIHMYGYNSVCGGLRTKSVATCKFIIWILDLPQQPLSGVPGGLPGCAAKCQSAFHLHLYQVEGLIQLTHTYTHIHKQTTQSMVWHPYTCGHAPDHMYNLFQVHDTGTNTNTPRMHVCVLVLHDWGLGLMRLTRPGLGARGLGLAPAPLGG